MKCAHCSARIPSGADFCPGCGQGADLAVVAPRMARTDERGAVALPRTSFDWRSQVFPGAAASTHERRTALALRAAAVLLVVIFLEVVAGVAQIGPDRSAHRAEKALTAVRSDLATVRKDLGATVTERDGLKAESAKLKGELDDSKKTAAFQTTQATTFKECFSAIKEIAEAPDNIAQPALNDLVKRANKSCDAAERLL